MFEDFLLGDLGLTRKVIWDFAVVLTALLALVLVHIPFYGHKTAQKRKKGEDFKGELQSHKYLVIFFYIVAVLDILAIVSLVQINDGSWTTGPLYYIHRFLVAVFVVLLIVTPIKNGLKSPNHKYYAWSFFIVAILTSATGTYMLWHYPMGMTVAVG